MKNQESTKPTQIFSLLKLFSVTILLIGCDPDESTLVVPEIESTYVKFTTSSLSIAEDNTSGIVVTLKLSKPAIKDMDLWLSVTDYYLRNTTAGMAGSVFSTNPEAVVDNFDGYTFIPLEVQKGDTAIEFTVFAVDNKVDGRDNPTLVITPERLKDYFALNTCTITIEDDE
jgi:hypothetical protein